MADSRYLLVDAPSASIELPRTATRQNLRTEGYRYFEQDLDVSNPREFFRKLRRTVQDHGYDVTDEQLNVQRGAVGDQVGEVVGSLAAVLTERIAGGAQRIEHPHRNLAVFGGLVGGFFGLAVMVNASNDYRGTDAQALLFGALAVIVSAGIAFSLWRSSVVRTCDVVVHTAIRMLLDGEVYASVGDATSESLGHGRRLSTQMLSSKVTVITSAEVRIGVDPARAKPVFGSDWRATFDERITDETRRKMSVARDNVVAAAEELNGRLSRLNEVA